MANSKLPTTGGHQVNLKLPLPLRFKCPFCKLLMCDAVQTYRGERACHSCYYQAKGDSNTCPIDEEPIEDGEIFQDKHARREILQIPIYCNRQHNGCNWEGAVIDIMNHTPVCSFEYVICCLCRDNIFRKDMDQHIKDICLLRPLECNYCKDIFEAQILKEHQVKCPRKPIECPYLCTGYVGLEELYNHVQNCPKLVEGTICPYQLMGCTWRKTSAENLNQHLQMAARIHAALAISNVNYFKTRNVLLNEELAVQQNAREQLSKNMEEDKNVKMVMELKMSDIEGKLYGAEKERVEMKEKIDSGAAKVNEDLKQINNLIQINSLAEINEKFKVMGMQLNTMETYVMSTPRVYSTESGASNSEEVRNSITRIEEMEKGGATRSTNLAELEQKLQLLESTCYNGHQLWKIDNVDYRLTQAITGKVTALHSAPCFQKRGGYKFCSRLYLNGDGMGRGTHVSLFFVLMKSEYDALFQWPFTERVTFRLINPTNLEGSVRESFMPDRNSSSFKRPTRDMNIAAGCPMFVLKEDLANYILEDCLYIETSISPP